MKAKLQIDGNYRILYIEGTSGEVQEMVYQAFNFGIVSKFPESYEEGDTRATIISTRDVFLRGILAIASVHVQSESDAGWIGYDRTRNVELIAILRAVRLLRSFDKVEKVGNATKWNPRTDRSVTPYAIGNADYCHATDNPWHSIAPSLS